MKVGGLFYGYGGIELALSSVLPDIELEWFAEFDPKASLIGAHHNPGVPNLGDVTKVDWASVPKVDVITGGSPCQDLSHAGKRAGMSTGTRSNLWVEMREAIAQTRPRLVIWENVRGSLSAAADSDMEHCPGCMGAGGDDGQPVLRALGRVLGDLAELGYDARWYGLRAADVGAPHGRFRVFLFATPADAQRGGRDGWAPFTLGRPEFGAATPGRGEDARDAGLTLLPTPRTSDTNGAGAHGDGGIDLRTAVTLLPTPAAMDGAGAMTREARANSGAGYGPALRDIPHLLPTPRATRGGSGTETLYGLGGERSNDERTQGVVLLPTPMVGSTAPAAHGQISGQWRGAMDRALQNWGEYAAAIARWEPIIGRPAPAPTEPGAKGQPRLSPAFVEWMMGLPEGHVTAVPGLSRNDQLKALGNGVVPQQCAAALRAFLADAWAVAA